MQLQWETLLEQARANHAQACANQATAEATLLAMRRTHAEWDGRDGEMEAWLSDAHGVAEVTRALTVSQGGAKGTIAEMASAEEPHELQFCDKRALFEKAAAYRATPGDKAVCTPPRAWIGQTLHECGGCGTGTTCERLWNPIGRTHSDADCVLSDGVDVGVRVDALVWALPRPPEGDNIRSGDGAAAEEVNGDKAQQSLGKIGEAADAGAPDEPLAAAGQTRQLGPVDG